MLRFPKISALSICVVMACGSSGDDAMTDSGSPGPDSSADGTKNDTGASDAPADSPIVDAPTDGTQDDAATDSPGDAPLDSPLDTGVDAPISDAGTCMSNNDCTKSEYCEKGTNNCPGTGVCMQKPQFCPQIYMPVCGCDKKTYSNSCYAHAGGTSVWYTSPCE